MPGKNIRRVIVVLGDQLSREISSLEDIDPAIDIVLMSEVSEEACYAPHHKQKLEFIFSAMRHFSSELQLEGIKVDYTTLEDPDNSGSLTGEARRTLYQ
jgi:deoxyribodipyrimidine photolyase-related protein